MAAPVVQTLEVLVDLFLRDDPSLIDEEEFVAEGCAEEAHDADGTESFTEIDQRMFAQRMGRKYKQYGDEFEANYKGAKGHTLTDEIKDLFSQLKEQADESLVWPRFVAIMDNAIKKTGLKDVGKKLGAVLVSVKGLWKLGVGLKNCTLRYIRERSLDERFQQLYEGTQSATHPSLD